MKKTIRYLRGLLADPISRRGVAALLGIVFNSAYAIWSLVVGIFFSNSWLVAVAAFYALAPIVRYLSIDGSLNLAGRVALSRLLVFVAFALSGLMLRTALTSDGTASPHGTVWIWILYAGFNLIRTLFNFLKKDGRSNALADSLRLTVTLISLFNLQTALLSEVEITIHNKMVINVITASAVSVSLFYLAKRSGIED